jgi:hypothetical protein
MLHDAIAKSRLLLENVRLEEKVSEQQQHGTHVADHPNLREVWSTAAVPS